MNVICSTKVEVYKCQGSITAIRFKEIDDEVMHVRSDIRRYPFTMTLTFVAVT